jgi:hypothetical protein
MKIVFGLILNIFSLLISLVWVWGAAWLFKPDIDSDVLWFICALVWLWANHEMHDDAYRGGILE